MNKYNKEEQDFLNLFDRESAAADSLFKAKLKTKMLKELEPKFNIFSFLNTAGFSFMAVIVFSFITVISGFFILSEVTKNQSVKSVTIVSDQIKQQVVEKVAEKTSVTALKLLNVDEFLANESIEKPIKPIDDSYNLKTTEVTYIPKKQSSAVCSNLDLPNKLTVTQLYEYFNENKSISKLTKNNQTIAIKEFEENLAQPTSYPVSYAPVSFAVSQDISVESSVLDFSNNFELIENLDKNVKSFTITDSVNFNCGNPASFPVSFANQHDAIIREFILNPDYSIKMVNLYLDQISTNTKLAEISISTSTKNVSVQEANVLLEQN